MRGVHRVLCLLLVLAAAAACTVGEASVPAAPPAAPSEGAASSAAPPPAAPAPADGAPALRTVADFRALITDLTSFWSRAHPGPIAAGPALRVLEGSASTGCGRVSEDDGTFYCEDNRTIYVQQADVDEIRAAPTTERPALLYLFAHEYAHFVQARVEVPEPDERTGPTSATVRYEQQADCLAGVYLGTHQGLQLREYAAVVRASGDDQAPDPPAPDEYDHGTGEQRLAAFTQGFRGDSARCL